MYLEIKTPGWGFVPSDVGKTVKITSLTNYLDDEPEALCQRHVEIDTQGTLTCSLESFLEENFHPSEMEDLEEEIKKSLCGDKLLSGLALEAPTEPLKSDGGSSLYYDLPIPQKLLDKLIERSEQGHCFIKTEELIQHFFDNDFSFGTALKSLVRAKGAIKGVGKAGNDLDYECNKVVYYAEQIREMGNSKEKQ